MTDLNTTPNNRLVIRSILGFGDIIVGVIVAVIGFLLNITPLTFTGVGLILGGVTVAILTSRGKDRSTAP